MIALAERTKRARRVAWHLRRAARATFRLRPVAGSALVLALAISIAGWPLVAAHLQAVAVLREVAGQRVPAALAEFADVPVSTRELTFPVESSAGRQMIRARLYVPAGRARGPGMVIFHGVHYLGIDEPRLIGFASAMAGCGIPVLTPELPDIKDYHVGKSSVRIIGESARWFAIHGDRIGTEHSVPEPVGVMGLSFSGGLALVAASEPEYRPYMRFVFAVGSQDSMERVTRYYRTGQDLRPDGSVERLPAHEYGPLVLEYEYLDDFVPASDLAPVRAVLRAHLYEDRAAEGRAFVKLNSTEKRETMELLDASSVAMRARIAASVAMHTQALDEVSPSGRLRHLTTPVYLLHGQADNIIPAAETLWTAREIPSKDLKAVLVSPVLSHIDLDGAEPGAMDEWHLVHFFAEVLEATEQRS